MRFPPQCLWCGLKLQALPQTGNPPRLAKASAAPPQSRLRRRRTGEWSSQGFLTVQFLLALTIVMFFIMSFLTLALTLIHGSITQYITYSAARALALGRENRGAQTAAAVRVYKKLRKSNPGADGLIPDSQFTDSSGGSGWFYIQEDAGIGFNHGSGGYEDDPGTKNYWAGRQLFYGVFVKFKSFITQFKIPGLMTEDAGELDTVIGSYLGREPSTKECKDFFADNPFKQHLPDSYRNFLTRRGSRFRFTHPDNGC